VKAGKGEGMSTKKEIAASKFSEGFNCAQSVLFAFCDEIGMEENSALKVACGFGAGMGRCQEVCGAVSGGIMVIGAKYGRGANDEKSSKEITYTKVQELMKRFTDTYGTVICRKLLKDCDLTTNEGQTYFRENNLGNRACRLYVESVVEMLDGII
jgi:C_GCAxxG_C_C family probable redox protein